VVHLDPDRMPAHVALVMDGNGRWAQQRGLKRTDGHAAGEEALFDTVEGGLEIGLSWMTVFAFSTENWRRPLDEVRYLMNFNERLLVSRREELHEKGVRVRFIGRRGGRVPARVRRRIEETEELTRRNTTMTLAFAFNYGSRAELVDAARAMGREVKAGPVGAHFRRVPDLELPLVAARLRGALLHRRALARLPPGAPVRRDRGVPEARTPLRLGLNLSSRGSRRTNEQELLRTPRAR
jgi:hypothetical protein